MKSGNLDDGCHFGLLFDSLFDDINETLFFSLNSDGIRVIIDPNYIKNGALLEMPYGQLDKRR